MNAEEIPQRCVCTACAEARALLEKNKELLAIIANTPEASPELMSAAESVKIKTDTVDRLINNV